MMRGNQDMRLWSPADMGFTGGGGPRAADTARTGAAFDAFTTSPSMTGQQVPMGVLTGQALFPLILGATFPHRAWDAGLYAQTVLAEFAASGWVETVRLEPPPSEAAELAAEIRVLIELAKQRPARAAEIAAQAQDATVYWADLLMAGPASFPATSELIEIGKAVGHMVTMHFKQKFGRARPVQVYPAIMPPFLTPPHPSYPNSHALQGLLMSSCVALAAPAMKAPLMALAERVGENREIAGVHFPSDRVASKARLPQIMALLEKGPLFQEVAGRARLEWAELNPVPFPDPVAAKPVRRRAVRPKE